MFSPSRTQLSFGNQRATLGKREHGIHDLLTRYAAYVVGWRLERARRNAGVVVGRCGRLDVDFDDELHGAAHVALVLARRLVRTGGTAEGGHVRPKAVITKRTLAGSSVTPIMAVMDGRAAARRPPGEGVCANPVDSERRIQGTVREALERAVRGFHGHLPGRAQTCRI